jgi:Flp pilus assembly pilin Flp
MVSIQSLLTVLLRRKDRDAPTADYGPMAAVTAAVIVTAVTLIGTSIDAGFGDVANTI